MAGFDLGLVAAAARAKAGVWEAAGVRWDLIVESGRSGPGPGLPAASVTCETGRVVARLTVHADGEADLGVVQRSGALSSRYRYHLASAGDVDTCLDELTAHVVPPG